MKSISFQIATRHSSQQFSHFVSPIGEVRVTDPEAELVKVGVVAETAADVTDDQRETIMQLAAYATHQNKDVAITFGVGLSPFTPPKVTVIEAKCAN